MKHVKMLHAFMMRQLLSITKIRRQEHKLTNLKVRQWARRPSMEDLLIRKNLRRTGHLLRMPTDRLPRQILYSQLPDGQRLRGRPRLRHKDSIKRNLKKRDIDTNSWKSVKPCIIILLSSMNGQTPGNEQCTVPRVGKNSPSYKYSMTVHDKLKGTTCVKVWIDNELFLNTKYTAPASKKANLILGLMQRSFEHIVYSNMPQLYKAIVLSHLEYGNTVW